jgi:hypothetical protein
MKLIEKQKGISVLYAVFVVVVLLAISLGLSSILISQIKTLGEAGHSVVAFYAADSGVEKVLMDRQSPDQTSGYYDGSLSADISYSLYVTEGGSGDCSSDYYYCIKSIGSYKDTRRAIEINY